MDVLARAAATLCLTKAGFVAGTTTTLSTTGVTYYGILGKQYYAAKLTNGATPTTDLATGAAFLPILANNGSVFTLGFDTSGALQAVQGSIQPLDVNGNFINAPQFGPIPNGFCPAGYLVVKAGSTANNTTGWIFGSSNMSSVTGITYSFADVMDLPARPVVS